MHQLHAANRKVCFSGFPPPPPPPPVTPVTRTVCRFTSYCPEQCVSVDETFLLRLEGLTGVMAPVSRSGSGEKAMLLDTL